MPKIKKARNAHRKLKHAFKCSHCDLDFTTKYTLDRHLKGLTQQKSFSCKHCNHEFDRKENLLRHSRNVHDKNPLDCDKCDLTCDTN